MASELLTPEELANAVTLSSDLAAFATDNALSVDEVVENLRFRFTDAALSDGMSFEATFGDIRNRKISYLDVVLQNIARALPEGARNVNVLSRIDIRPYLDAMEGRDLEYDIDVRWSPDRTIRVSEFGTFDEPQIKKLRDAFEQKMRNVIASATNASTAEQVANINANLGYTPGTAGATPDADLAVSDGSTAPTEASQDWQNIVGSIDGQDGVSEEELRIAFTQTMDTDIFGLAGLVGEADNTLGMIEVGQSPFASLPSTQAPANPAAYRIPGAASRSAFYNWRALGDYLIKGQVTPTEIRTLQRKMVAAGLFDQMPDGFEPGDAVDRNTNLAWRALLAEAYRRKMPIHTTMNQLATERRRNIPSLQDPMAKSAMNYVVQNIIGRNLTDDEMTELRSYLIQIRDREGMAAAGIQQEVGFTEAGVSQFVETELGQEVQDVERAGSLDAYKAAMGAI